MELKRLMTFLKYEDYYIFSKTKELELIKIKKYSGFSMSVIFLILTSISLIQYFKFQSLSFWFPLVILIGSIVFYFKERKKEKKVTIELIESYDNAFPQMRLKDGN